MKSDADALPPRRLTPAFFGCFDWHSAVHSPLASRPPLPGPARRGLRSRRTRGTRTFASTPANVALEVRYVSSRPAFERPYGMAWLLQLAAELHEWDNPRCPDLARNPAPPSRSTRPGYSRDGFPRSRTRFVAEPTTRRRSPWVSSHDWARITGRSQFRDLVERRSLNFYGGRSGRPNRLRTIRPRLPVAEPGGGGPAAALSAARHLSHVA